MALPKVNDWNAFRNALKLLAESFPEQFGDWVLIGGGACWFYRMVPDRWADADFPVPTSSAAEEAEWSSEDIAFMGATKEEAEVLLGATFKAQTHSITFRGLEVDFLGEGVRLTASETLRNARKVRTAEVVFRVLDAASLCAEKLAVVGVKERPPDRLHLRVLESFLRCEFCREMETVDSLDAVEWVERTQTTKTADHDFFSRHEVMRARLTRGIAHLSAREHARIKHWAKHHLPGFHPSTS